MRYAILAAVLVSGCHLVAPAPPPMNVYDLGPPVASPVTGLPAVEIRVTAAAELRTRAMLYREATDAGRLSSYAEHRWAAPPALMLQRQLSLLTTAQSAHGAPGARVDIDLLAFEQYFDKERGTATLVAVATLANAEHECARNRFDVAAPMEGADAPSGARAFAAATVELAERLAAWIAAAADCVSTPPA